MLRQWLCRSSGAARSLVCSRCCKCYNRPLRLSAHSPLLQCSLSHSIRYLQTAVESSSDRIPLRKQLKQEAKALKARKKQRRENEEASREKWELTVGIEIHAQLDTESKLFSSVWIIVLRWWSYMGSLCGTNRSSNFDKRYPQFQCGPVRPGVSRQPACLCSEEDHYGLETR